MYVRAPADADVAEASASFRDEVARRHHHNGCQEIRVFLHPSSFSFSEVCCAAWRAWLLLSLRDVASLASFVAIVVPRQRSYPSPWLVYFEKTLTSKVCGIAVHRALRCKCGTRVGVCVCRSSSSATAPRFRRTRCCSLAARCRCNTPPAPSPSVKASGFAFGPRPRSASSSSSCGTRSTRYSPRRSTTRRWTYRPRKPRRPAACA
jgi:hypothetical protein